MKSERHFWATLNYVSLHNAVRHGYVELLARLAVLECAQYLEDARRDLWHGLGVSTRFLNTGNDWDPLRTLVGVPALAGPARAG